MSENAVQKEKGRKTLGEKYYGNEKGGKCIEK